MKDKEMIEEMVQIQQKGCIEKSEELCGITFCLRCYSEILYNAGYRKIDKDSIVLSREEYQDLKEYKNIAEQRKFNLDYANVELRRLTVELNSAEESNAKANGFLEKYRKELEITKQQLAQARKETAQTSLEEFICKLVKLRLLGVNDDLCYALLEVKDDLLKEKFGVEIKE